MAQQFSFDIVSEINFQELDNAVNQARKEVQQRYDFKGIETTIAVDVKEKRLTVSSGDEFHVKSAVDVLQNKMVKRGIHLKALKYDPIEAAAGATARQVIHLVVGIEKENAKSLVKMIKDAKVKAQAQIMEDQVRVSGKDKDELQVVQKLVREADLSFPVQFANYR